jgi:DNA-binding transcriptional regulator LsrR (DeoR family)
MITLNQKQKIIIAYHNQKKSQRRIAREVGLNRRTVARYIKDYDPQSQPKFQSKSRTFFHSLINLKSSFTSLRLQTLRPVTGTIDLDDFRMVYYPI